jgi:dolichol-phosphate mannosyltransferase
MAQQTEARPEQEPVAEKAALKLGLVIPTLNEAGNIGVLLSHVRSVLDSQKIPFEIIVVDDDSKDGTGDLVSAIAIEDPRVRLIVRKGEKGLSGAVIDGWAASDAAVLGVMDADLQHPPEMLSALYAAVRDGKDIAVGSRYTAGGGVGKWNFFRRFLSAAAVWATLPIQHAGARAKDPMSGFFMIRRECLEGVRLQREGFKLLLDVLVRGRARSLQEVPIAFGVRSQGASKANFKVGWDYARLLMKLYAWRCGFGR